MPRRKRQTNTFNLSFLDVMSCGFGAVILVFLIIDHSIEIQIQSVNAEVLSEVNLLEEDIRDGEEGLVRLRNAVSSVDLDVVEATRRARVVTEELGRLEALVASLEESDVSETTDLDALKAEINVLEEQIQQLHGSLPTIQSELDSAEEELVQARADNEKALQPAGQPARQPTRQPTPQPAYSEPDGRHADVHWHGRDARRPRGRVKACPKDDASKAPHLSAFLAYKAGMTHILRDVDKPGSKAHKKEVVQLVVLAHKQGYHPDDIAAFSEFRSNWNTQIAKNQASIDRLEAHFDSARRFHFSSRRNHTILQQN